MEYKTVPDVIHALADRLERGFFSRVFGHVVNVKWYTPPVLTGKSWELDYPYRKSRTVVLRYSWGRSLVLGVWSKKGYDEDTALLEATLYGRERTADERRAWDETQLFVAENPDFPVLEGGSGLRYQATSEGDHSPSVNGV